MAQTAGAEDTRFLPLADHVRKELKLLLEDLEEEDSVLVALSLPLLRWQDTARARL